MTLLGRSHRCLWTAVCRRLVISVEIAVISTGPPRGVTPLWELGDGRPQQAIGADLP